MLEYFIGVIIGLYGIVHLIYVLHFWLKPSKIKILHSLQPLTIIIAVRNEEKNLPHLLQSLLLQDYPKEKMEVIIGNDQSEDNSLQILREWQEKYQWIKVINIEKKLPHLQGKQNVLAQLIPLASHENILMTDADIILPPTWIKTMLAHLDKQDMISAPTIVQGNRLFHHLQSLDWLFSISVIKPFSDWGLPITAVGNNMGIKKNSYQKIGGYENLPFSLTEDYILFEKVVLKHHGKFEWVHLPQVLNISQPVYDLKTFLHQRKRWYEGAKKGPWYAIFIFIHHIFIYPALFLSFFIFPLSIAIFIVGFKWLIDFLWLWIASASLKKQNLLKYFIPFQIYFMLITLLLPWYFWTAQKVKWKGRIYQ
ncbi:MAG: hypothetical protein KatS3mg035_0859 [Bacteroidia bacterium]|nr:MAG: hypothetical protein KatS3mg035_0859 [Bacteroidia bacterium]